MGDIDIFCQGVLVSGRYGHGNPTKPVNTELSALHRFQSYIISVCVSAGEGDTVGNQGYCSYDFIKNFYSIKHYLEFNTSSKSAIPFNKSLILFNSVF